MTVSKTAAEALQERINVIEESYEFCLAYAAKGVNAEMARSQDTQVRECLRREAQVLPELADVFGRLVEERSVSTPERYHEFIDVLRRDASDALAAIRLVLAQAGITSQMIDNLNGLIHLRALLTDAFLIDEILRPDADQPPRAEAT